MPQRHRLISPPASTRAVAAVMKANKKRDSKPELFVRRLLHALGYRYRLHARDLPGSPDIVFRSRHKVIFVHGCFWHQHPDARCPLRTHPRSNIQYWRPKLSRNRERDKENEKKLADIGWTYLTVWECELKEPAVLRARLVKFLEGPRRVRPRNKLKPCLPLQNLRSQNLAEK